MPFINAHAAEFTPVANPQRLLEQVDPRLFERFRTGAELHVSRQSTPHNWWLSKAGCRDAILHHWDARTSPEQAFLAFSRKLPSSLQKVPNGGWLRRRGEALPVSDTWVYDEAAYQACVQRWARALTCAQDFNRLAGSQPADLRSLRRFGLYLARRLKRGAQYPMATGGEDIYEALCAMGFATVSPEGYITATEQLKRTPIPNAAHDLQVTVAA